MSEIIPIVNSNDEIIKYKKRGLESGNDIGRISALWMINSQQQILLAQRSYNKKYGPGKWGPAVTGTVNKEETYLQNIIKETQEEIGVMMKECNFKKVDKTFNKTRHSFFCQWYFVTLDWPLKKFVFPKDEVEQLKWVNKKEFEKDLKNHPEKYTTNMNQHYAVLKKYF